ncbi:hypothetical protein F1654_12560 [Alkalicaulis satelles]|uniref:Apple domain-containing protein n=1 Tax=Alkalicaulis satelles TaxID=2609175 RepID=A0A5M6ZHK5_9PROT|nr:hypothetical protein [Alkalicaulis satelles]KAA5801711.1 hypothetical protein F1654_12560 [Alkalicaulis satelles]
MNSLILSLILLGASPAGPLGAVMADYERRGPLIDRPDGLAELSARACAAVCALNEGCAAWSWRPAFPDRPGGCAILGAVTPARFSPGSVTGLSPSIIARIDAAAERAPNARERAALEALEASDRARPAPQRRPSGAGLAGG